MGFIGIMSVAGQVVDVLFCLRSLLTNLMHTSIDMLPGTFDSNFIKAVKAGSTQSHGRLVKSYHLQWWKGNEPPNLNQRLNGQNIWECWITTKKLCAPKNPFRWMHIDQQDTVCVTACSLMRPTLLIRTTILIVHPTIPIPHIWPPLPPLLLPHQTK